LSKREETQKRYVEGAVISGLRLYRHWRKRGLSKDESFKRAVKQALGMMEVSGLDKNEILEVMEDLKMFIDEIINELKNANTQSS